jgi:hypothetical protein
MLVIPATWEAEVGSQYEVGPQPKENLSEKYNKKG